MALIRLLILFSLCLVISCGSKKQVIGIERVVKDSTIVREIPVLVHVPGATVYSPSINIHQLDSMLKAGVPAKVITERLIREDPETKLKVGLLIDQLGNLTAVCEQQDRMIKTLQLEIERYRSESEKITVQVFKTWYQQAWENFIKLLIPGLFLTLIIFLIFKFLT